MKVQELGEYEFSNTNQSRRRYDWDTLLDGRVWSLDQGEDYGGQTAQFVSRARRLAKDRGLDLKVDVFPGEGDGLDTVVMQACEKP